MKLKNIFWLDSSEPEAILWRSTLMFVALDVFFTGLVGAYAYAHAGVLAVLLFIMAQQACSMLGQILAQNMMYNYYLSPLKIQRVGVYGLAFTLLLTGIMPAPVLYLLIVLCLCGGFSRGITYGARLWMESQLAHAGRRQHYLSMVEGSAIVFKLAAPMLSLLVLSFTTQFEIIFLLAGTIFCMLLAITRPQCDVFTPPGDHQLLALWKQKEYWQTAPYFLVEGAGHALRTALFVSGAMSVVGSLKAYAMVELCAGLVAAAWLFSQTGIALTGPSLKKLRKFLTLLALAWLALLGAMWNPILFPAFIVLFTLSLPLVNAQKSGVTLIGMLNANGGVESNLMARSILLTIARVMTLGTFIIAYLLGTSQQTLLVAMGLTAILLLPIEYWTAQRLHRPAPVLITLPP